MLGVVSLKRKKMIMNTQDRLELSVIVMLVGMVWFGASLFPPELSVGNLILMLSALLLLQSLIRDLSILFKQRKKVNETPVTIARCMCVESAVGATGILLGIALIAFNVFSMIVMSSLRWTLCVLATVIIGFLIKDFVFQWKPWRIRREKDHMNVIFSWKPPES